MFAPLPDGFPKLQEAADALGHFSLAAPPAIEHLGLRVRKLYEQVRERGYAGLSRGALRRLPYALWIDGQPDLVDTDRALVQDYWDKHLPSAVAQARTAKRWLTPLFYVYCHGFDRRKAAFQDFALRLRQALGLATGPAAQWMSELQASHRWFVPEDVGLFLGKAMIQSTGSMREVLESMNLWSGFLEEPIAAEAFAGALRAPNDVLSREPVIERIKRWARADVTGARGVPIFRYPEHRVALADGLVRPWLQRAPNDAVRNGLTSFLIKHYGDPRTLTQVHEGHHWQGVSSNTLNAVKRWLVGDTLRGFMHLLQETADEIWRYRERFWMAYFDQGYVEEAWLALGSQAAWLANRNFSNAEWARYGSLVGGAAPNQSVLFLRIGQIVFMEWSHNGSLRALRYDDPKLPSLYAAEYHGADLRTVNSLDFHHGTTQQPQLSHFSSQSGTWQRKARDFIAEHTGVRLNDRAIIG